MTSSAYTAPLPLSEETKHYCLKLGVPIEVVEAVGVVEGGRRPNPYLIRINGPYRVSIGPPVKEIAPNVFDCRNELLCKTVVKVLTAKGLRNIDIGYFQINYLYAPRNGISRRELLKEGFNIDLEARLACKILSRNLKRFGYNANAVAAYHSLTPYRNSLYAWRWWRVYRRIIRERAAGKGEER